MAKKAKVNFGDEQLVEEPKASKAKRNYKPRQKKEEMVTISIPASLTYQVGLLVGNHQAIQHQH